ncbi:MAG: hypothetical protein A2W85_18285 [Bacteroidetes bacterium GWF2_41_31]|nr:MAG: hypothetical protein A2W85_18285 [Bacteroidetes bacterium GWF2_41_31]
MFGLFKKKPSHNKEEQKIFPQLNDMDSPISLELSNLIDLPAVKELPIDIFFNIDSLQDDKKQENVYLYEWLMNDGDWVEEGQPLYIYRVGETQVLSPTPNSSYLGVQSGVFVSQNITALRSGIIQIFKRKNELIINGDKIYTIHPLGAYSFENSPFKESYYFFFNKYECTIPVKYSHSREKEWQIREWYKKEDGELVKQGETILTLGYYSSLDNKETIDHHAEKDGFLDINKANQGWNTLVQNELVYVIHEKDENRIKRKFVNMPDIVIDDFTGKKNIKWKQIGSIFGYAEGITSKSIDNQLSFTFSFNHIAEKDFIVFQFYSKEMMLSKDDIVSFLFSDNRIISFTINGISYKSSHPYIEKLFENKVSIADDELHHFEMVYFVKWKITLKKQNQEIIGGNEGYLQYKSHSNLAAVIQKFSKEYRELVRTEIVDYKPLIDRDNLSSYSQTLTEDECHVYLMMDTINFYCKIGISNKPEWREKTLQSEKPTIELLASKKFVSRKMASSFEKALHDTFSNKRIRGEWFQLDFKDIEEIKKTLNN